MNTKINKSLILNKIKFAYGIEKDADFARFLGIKPQTLASWHSRNTFDIELLFAKCEDIDGNFILTGKEPIKLKKNYVQEDSLMMVNEIHQPKIKSRVVDLQEVPLYELEATAGVNEVLGQGNLSVPLDYIKIPNLPKCDGALYVRGDSMYPLLKSGDIVMYKIIHDRQKIIWGEMYLVHIINDGDEYFFTKFVKQSEKIGYASFVSHNQHHQTIEFPIDSIKSLAIVQASVRINTQM